MLALLMSLLAYAPANEFFQGTQLNVGANYENTPMTLTGFGLGLKKLGPLAHAKIAVNEFFCEKPELFSRTEDGVLSSLNNVGLMNMHITFLRSLTADQVQGFISQYLNNNLNENERVIFKNDVQNIMNAIGGESVITSGKSISIVGDIDGNDVHYFNSAGLSTTIHSQNTGFVLKVFSIWFDRSSMDSDAYSLFKALLMKREVTAVKP